MIAGAQLKGLLEVSICRLRKVADPARAATLRAGRGSHQLPSLSLALSVRAPTLGGSLSSRSAGPTLDSCEVPLGPCRPLWAAQNVRRSLHNTCGDDPRPIAAGALLDLVPEALDEFSVPKLWLGNTNNGSLGYTYSDHRSSFHWLCGYASRHRLGGLPRGTLCYSCTVLQSQ